MIIKLLSDSKQISWEDDGDIDSYMTHILIDEKEYIINCTVSSSGSYISLKDLLSKQEIYSGTLFNLIQKLWYKDSSIFESEGKLGEVFLFDGYNISSIIHISDNNELVYSSDLGNKNYISELIQKDFNVVKYITEYLNEKLYTEIDLDLSDLNKIPEILKEFIAKQRGKLDLSSLEMLSVKEANELSKHCGELILSGLISIEDGVADKLSKHSGILDLSALDEISDISAKYLSKYEGILCIENLQTISDTAISSLLDTKGIIICQGQLYNEYRKKYADSIRYEKIYFPEKNLSISYLSIIPHDGICLDFIKNIDNIIYVVLDKKNRISITDFLQAFEYSELDILNLFNVPFVQIKNQREELEKEIGSKFATKIYKKWVEDFVNEDTEEVISLEQCEEIYNINEKLTRDSIQTLIELPIEYIYLQSDTSINIDLYLKSYLIGITTTIVEAQQLFYKSILFKDAYDNQIAEEFAKNYSDGKAVNLGPEGRKKLNKQLDITSNQSDGLYLEDYMSIIKYLIAN
jgi:hypothetical protein